MAMTTTEMETKINEIVSWISANDSPMQEMKKILPYITLENDVGSGTTLVSFGYLKTRQIVCTESANIQSITAQGSITTQGSIIAQAGISTRGGLIADYGISTNGSISANGNISGADINASGNISAGDDFIFYKQNKSVNDELYNLKQNLLTTDTLAKTNARELETTKNNLNTIEGSLRTINQNTQYIGTKITELETFKEQGKNQILINKTMSEENRQKISEIGASFTAFKQANETKIENADAYVLANSGFDLNQLSNDVNQNSVSTAENLAKITAIEAKIADGVGGAEIDEIEAKIEALTADIQTLRDLIKGLKTATEPTLNNDVNFTDWYKWACRREPLMQLIDDPNFWAWEDAWAQKDVLIKGIEAYFQQHVLKQVSYSLALHYAIMQDFNYLNADGAENSNPLYAKYKIAGSGGGITQSVSDVSSSASIVVTDAIKNVSILGQDLLLTPYGKYAYGILSTLNIYPVLL